MTGAVFDLDRYLVDSLSDARAVNRPRGSGHKPSLADTIEEQAETIRQLRAILVPPLVFPTRWKLTSLQQKVLSALLGAAPHPRSAAQIVDLIYSHEADDPPDEKIVDVILCKMRKALAADDIEIGTRWGVGRYIDSATARRIHALCRAEAGATIVTICTEPTDSGPIVSVEGDIVSRAQLDEALAAIRKAGVEAFGGVLA